MLALVFSCLGYLLLLGYVQAHPTVMLASAHVNRKPIPHNPPPPWGLALLYALTKQNTGSPKFPYMRLILRGYPIADYKSSPFLTTRLWLCLEWDSVSSEEIWCHIVLFCWLSTFTALWVREATGRGWFPWVMFFSGESEVTHFLQWMVAALCT